MPAKTEPAINPKLLSNLFARFTADRDALLAALERCEQRLVDLSERLGSPASAAEPGTAEAKADRALALAKEALEVAHEAMQVVRQGRS